jgi:hypothetical protein
MAQPELGKGERNCNPTDDGKAWNLTGRLDRSMGCIAETYDQQFTIYPASDALETMAGMSHGHYVAL